MHPETLNKPLRTARTFVRRSLSERLRAAIIALADGHGKVAGHSEKSWASITFAGTRHSLQLVFEGCDAVEAGERMIAALPDHEFTIPRQLVADATIIAVESTLLPAPEMTVSCQLLLLEDV